MRYDGILSRLQRLRRLPGESRWLASCPTGRHKRGDVRPSLLVWVSEQGRLCVQCRSQGCTFGEVAAALGTQKRDWFPEDNTMDGKKLVAAYDYHDRDGKLLYQVCRFEPKQFVARKPTDGGGWSWGIQGTPTTLYRLPELLADTSGRMVLVVEGEKDVDTLAAAGFLATTSPFGSGKWRPEFGALLKGHPVAVIPDRDEAGMRHALDVLGSLLWCDSEPVPAYPSVRLVRLTGEAKDVTDWLAQHSSNELKALVRLSPEWRRHDATSVRGAA